MGGTRSVATGRIGVEVERTGVGTSHPITLQSEMKTLVPFISGSYNLEAVSPMMPNSKDR